jgi:hypothetical protein
MTHRNARRLLLLAALLLPGTAWAQRGPAPGSHRPLDDLLPSSEAAEQAMADRLQQLHDFRQFQEYAQKLLDNPALLDKLPQNLGPIDVRQLLEKFQRQQIPGNDPTLKKFLDKADQLPKIEREQADAIKRLAQQIPTTPRDPEPAPPGRSMPQQPQTKGPPPTNPSGVTGPRPFHHRPQAPRSAWDQFQEKSQSWFKDNVADRVGDFVRDLAATQDGDSLSQVLRNLGKDDADLPRGLAERLRGLADTIAGIKGRLPDGMSSSDAPSFFEGLRLPSPPKINAPAVNVDFSGAGVGPWWLWLAVLAALGFALYRTAARRAAGAAHGGWRLGPWPVAPAAVATRRELVAAFEYLALLCLGPDARARHHLDLADRLGGGADDPQRRRAAGELAHLYEQARYAPDDEPLTPDDLTAARRDLCLLAGVAAA